MPEPDDDWIDDAELDGDLGDITGDRSGEQPGSLDDEGALGASEAADAEDAMLLSWADDDDALGTESGGFGPDRPRDARIPGLYSSGEIDEDEVEGEAVDADDNVDPYDAKNLDSDEAE